MLLKRSCPAVSHICSLTTVELSISTTRFVRKEAPIVECIEGAKAFFTYRWTRQVLPTPCEPSTTILASRLLLIAERRKYGGGGRKDTERKGKRVGSGRA